MFPCIRQFILSERGAFPNIDKFYCNTYAAHRWQRNSTQQAVYATDAAIPAYLKEGRIPYIVEGAGFSSLTTLFSMCVIPFLSSPSKTDGDIYCSFSI